MDFLKRLGHHNGSSTALHSGTMTKHSTIKSPTNDKLNRSVSTNQFSMSEHKSASPHSADFNDHTELSTRVDMLEAQLKSRIETIQSLTDRIMDISVEYEEYKKQYNGNTSSNSQSQTSELNELQRQYDIIQSELQHKREECKDITNKLNTANDKYSELQTKYADQIHTFRSCTASANSTLVSVIQSSSYVHQIQLLEQQCNTYKSQLDQCKRKHGTAAQSDDLLDTDVNSHDLQQQISTLQQQLIARDTVIGNNNIQIQSLNDAVNEAVNVKQQLNAVQSELDTYKLMNHNSENDALNILRSELEQCKAEINQKQQQINDLTNTNLNITNELTTTKHSAEQYEQDNTLLHRTLTELRTANTQIQQQLTTQADAMAQLENRCNQQLQQVTEQHNEITALHTRNNDLTEQLKQNQTELAVSINNLTQTSSALTDTQTTLQTTQSQLVTTRQLFSDQIGQYESQLAALRVELQTMKQTLDDTQQRLQLTETQLHTTQSDYTSYQATTTQQISELNGELDKKKQALSVYHAQIKQNALQKQQQQAEQQRLAKLEQERKSKSILTPFVSLIHRNRHDNNTQQCIEPVDMFDSSREHSVDNIPVPMEELSEEVAVSLSKRIQAVEAEKLNLQHEISRLKRLLLQEKFLTTELQSKHPTPKIDSRRRSTQNNTFTPDVVKQMLADSLAVNKQLQEQIQILTNTKQLITPVS